MVQQTINIGALANDGTGDAVRSAFDKCNDNFTDLYSRVAALPTGPKWYVRPQGGVYGLEDGTSYANAWDGFADINWASIQPGDTLYVAGEHNGSPGLVVGASGTVSNSILIASCTTAFGASDNDPGTIWGGRKQVATGWTGPVNDVYTHTGVFTVNGDLVCDEDLIVLTPAADLAACEVTEQSYFQPTVSTINVHPGPGGIKVMYWSTFCPINISEESYITIRGLNLYMEDGTSGVIRVYKHLSDTIGPLGIWVDQCTIAIGILYGIRSGADGTEVECTNCTFIDCAAGFYHTNLQGASLRFVGNEFYHTSNIYKRSPFRDETGDEFAIGIQGGMDETEITDNYIHDLNSGGIYLYIASGVGREIPNAQILRNRISLDTTVTERMFVGIHIAGDNTENLADGWRGCVIANNIIENAVFNSVEGGSFIGGVRLKVWEPTDPAHRVKVINNTFVNSCTGLYGRAAVGGSLACVFQNNIVSDPETDQYFMRIENMATIAGVICDYNIYHGAGLFKWNGGTNDADLAAWKITSGQDAASFTTDPDLDVNYRIASGSSAHNAGTDTDLTDDADGNPRPVGAYDIGAYEVQA